MFKKLCLLQSKIEASFFVCKLNFFFQLSIRGSSSIEISFGRISQFTHFPFFVTFSFWLDCSISKQNTFHEKLLMGWRGSIKYVSQRCLCYSNSI
jgi:hypothetical protein